jgi:DNA-binding CsgD family transcriptional regulator
LQQGNSDDTRVHSNGTFIKSERTNAMYFSYRHDRSGDEVLRLVAQGLTNEQVAEQLTISPRTVKTHLTAIYGKIGVTSRNAAIRYAIEYQFV